MENEKHYSCSQITEYLKCPYSYKLKYIDRIPTPKNVALVFGSSIHRALEFNFKSKLHSKKDKPKNKVVDNFVEELETHKEEISWTKGFDYHKDMGVKLLKLYMEDYASAIMPAAIEKKFVYLLPNTGYKFLGYIDLITDNLTVIDHKTAAKSPHDIAMKKYEYQLSSYSLGMQQLNPKTMEFDEPITMQEVLDKKDICTTRLDFFMKYKNPEIRSHLSVKRPKDYYYFINLTNTVIESIENRSFFPQPFQMLCNRNYCDFYDECNNRLEGGVLNE